MPTQQYEYIRAWGSYMGSSQFYINNVIQKAIEMDAPANAIYERDGEWHTTDTITNESARAALRLPPLTGLEPIVMDRYEATHSELNCMIEFVSVNQAVSWSDHYAKGFSVVRLITVGNYLSDTCVLQYVPNLAPDYRSGT